MTGLLTEHSLALLKIVEYQLAISVSDHVIRVQCRGRRGRRGRLEFLRYRVPQGRDCFYVPGDRLVHGHRGQHMQSNHWTRRRYTLDSLTEQFVGLSVTQPIVEKRRWRLIFISFYPVTRRCIRTRTIRWRNTLPIYHVA